VSDLVRGTREEVVESLRSLLLGRGVPASEVDAAVAEHRLDLLVADRLLLPSSWRQTPAQLLAAAGVDEEEGERLWRALGFPEVAEDEAAFTEQDLEALRTMQGLAALGLATPRTAVQLARVLGTSMARLAEALVSATDVGPSSGVHALALDAGDADDVALAQRIAFAAEVVLPSMERLILYAWRRHLQAAVRRFATLRRESSRGPGGVAELAVGFADMVGFTALSSQLSAAALAEVVDRFESLAHDTVVAGGGRVVKMIGDEAMFVSEDLAAALGIALDLVEAYADDELLSDVRVGLAAGPVLAREGDYFGAVVNRASRIVNIADAGTVLVSGEVHDRLAGVAGMDDGLVWEQLRSRELKDLGRVHLWAVRRADRPAASPDRRAGLRWRRLTDLRQDFEALRARGEAVLGGLVGAERGRPAREPRGGPSGAPPAGTDPVGDEGRGAESRRHTPDR
jgi:adenylate cyclase